MRRFALIICILLYGIAVKAQDWDFGDSGNDDVRRNQFGIELGVGGTGDITVDLGLRWQMNIHPNIGWDVLTLKAITVPDYLEDSITPQLLTGLRLTSPSFSGLTAYLTGRAGYGYWINGEEGGFCYEIGAGVNVTKHISLGYAYNRQDGNLDFKYHAFRVGFSF